jgi:hypothetical protein
MDTWILMNYHRPNTPTNLGQRNQQKVEKSGQIMLEETFKTFRRRAVENWNITSASRLSQTRFVSVSRNYKVV